MMNDELQVLGTEIAQKKKRKRIKIALISVAILIAIALLGWMLKFAVIGYQTTHLSENTENTIIPELQHTVDSLLKDKLEEIDGLQGQAIVMEVQTGKILAMAGSERRYDGKFQSCNNFAYQQEMGSVMKVASLLAILETGEVKLNDEVDTGNGVWAVDDEYAIKDYNWHSGGFGKITIERAFELSSNIGICKAVMRAFGNGHQAFFNQLEKMSYGKPDQIEGIEGLKPTQYSSPKDSDWVNRRIYWSAIGYERKIAPIQVLTFYNAIANDGKMMKPTLRKDVSEIINPQIASKKNVTLIQHALDSVVSKGVGQKAGTPILRVAGKTGTSQVAAYYEMDNVINEYQLAFCGYYPADKPMYSIIVTMNKLGLPASGGGMAGPVFHYIVKWMISHGMPNLVYVDDETNDSVVVNQTNIDSITIRVSKEDE